MRKQNRAEMKCTLAKMINLPLPVCLLLQCPKSLSERCFYWKKCVLHSHWISLPLAYMTTPLSCITNFLSSTSLFSAQKMVFYFSHFRKIKVLLVTALSSYCPFSASFCRKALCTFTLHFFFSHSLLSELLSGSPLHFNKTVTSFISN